jgi:hypothetical protein
MISGLQRKLALGDRPRVWKTVSQSPTRRRALCLRVRRVWDGCEGGGGPCCGEWMWDCSLQTGHALDFTLTSIGPSIPIAFLPNIAKACRYRTIARLSIILCALLVCSYPSYLRATASTSTVNILS